MVASLVLILGLAPPANAHFLSWDLVDGREIRYNDYTKWDDARSQAASTWNTLGSIYIAPDIASTIADLSIYDYTRDDGLCGLTNSDGKMFFNDRYFNTATSTKRRACADHEMGHALGLDHSYTTQVMDPCPVCSNPSYYTTPQSHDVSDYRQKWG